MRWLPLFLVCASLVSCTTIAGLVGGALTGAPGVAANVQAGRTNAQTVGNTEFSVPRIIRP